MEHPVIYLRMRHRLQVKPNATITIGQVAQFIVYPEIFKEKIGQMQIYQVTPRDKNFIIIDLMKVIELLQRLDQSIDIQSIGEAQTIVEVIDEKKTFTFFSIALIWIILFIGAALAIMNFHEDVSMQKVQQKLYFILTGKITERPYLFQVPYSLGIGIGMILFFNHLFKKRFNEEPSPLEVEMFNYQQDLDHYVILHENKDLERKMDDSS